MISLSRTYNNYACLFVEITCPSYDVKNADVIVDGHTVMTVTCRSGYFFPDNTTVRTAYCLDDRSWSSTVPSCRSKTSHHAATVAIHFGALICIFGMLDTCMKSVQHGHHFWHKNRISCTLGHSCTYDGTHYSSDAHVTVPCAPGERFNDGLEVVRSVCSSRRGWQPDIHACAGTSRNI